jgi:transcriptional regulator with XRE-family HTH domain
MATALGLSQSAFSRLESGDSVLNLSQLRNSAAHLGMRPAELLTLADHYEAQLRQQGVKVISEKVDQSAAVVLGLGLLGALLLTAR